MADASQALQDAGYELTRAPPPAGVFEFGLVLAGAVSAGSYTAGVLDFLIEALDAWTAAKAADTAGSVPPHDVRLRVIAGASAGSVCGATAAVALNYRFPHVRADVPDATRAQNPFYKCWVVDADIAALLDPSDLVAGRKVASVLNSTALDTIKNEIVGYTSPERVTVADRPYMKDGLRILMTVANLRGTPYFLAFEDAASTTGYVMKVHRDYRGFCMELGGVPAGAKAMLAKSDDLTLPALNARTDPVWDLFGATALGSAAFPVGLAPRLMTRPYADYAYRYAVLPGDGTAAHPPTAVSLRPMWPDAVADAAGASFSSYVVDGGTMNNEPLDLARAELAGILGRNPRLGDEACRAVVLVDPFPDQSVVSDRPVGDDDGSLVPSLLALVGAWKEQSRFSPADLALALDETVYSRFLIAPRRFVDGALQKTPIACGLLGGFSGFLCDAYRHHDFLLGRRNCQQFLRSVFVLPVENPLFAGWTHLEARALLSLATTPTQSGPDPRQMMLPVIPLVGTLATVDEPQPPWPTDRLDVGALQTLVEQRMKVLVPRFVDDLGITGLEALGIGLGAKLVAGGLSQKVMSIIGTTLSADDCGLMTKP